MSDDTKTQQSGGLSIGGNVGGDAAQGNIDKSQTGVTNTKNSGPQKGPIAMWIGGAVFVAGLLWYAYDAGFISLNLPGGEPEIVIPEHEPITPAPETPDPSIQ